jgi:sugar O-acyltransferase (sialic acid O-acetyltransferase NeuD family)
MSIPLVIFGTGEAAEIAHYYFSAHTEYEVKSFTVDGAFISADNFCGLPIVPFETIAQECAPDEYRMFVALGYSKVNFVRKEKYICAKKLGYELVSYISAKSNVLNGYAIGDNCFILEDNTIQPFVRIGNNVTLWSGNHIGHHSTISDHCFIASHVVVSGGVHIAEQCFLGVNSTIRDHISVGERCVIGAGALLLNDAQPEGVYMGAATARSKVPSVRLRGI